MKCSIFSRDGKAAAVEKQLLRTLPPPPFVRSWRQVAEEYVTIYKQTNESRQESL